MSVSCAGDVGRLVGSKTFNAELFKAGGVVIGGITTASATGLQQKLGYAEILRQIVRQHAPDMAIVSPREVYDALGGNLYTQMLDSYTFHETGSAVFMNLLQEKFPTTRYVIYARVENSEVQRRYQKLPDGRGYDLHTVLGVSVSMRVFDLRSRQLQVWAAGLQQAGVSKRRVFGQYTGEQLKGLYPEPPATERVYRKTCNGLITALLASGQ